MFKKNVIKRVLITLIGVSIILGLFNSAYAAEPENYRRYNREKPDGKLVKKPIANFTVTVKKPDGSERTNANATDQAGTALAYNEFGSPINPSIIPKITAYVGDTLTFKDAYILGVPDSGSVPGSGGTITACDFQWYSSQTSGKTVDTLSQFNARTFKLTQPGNWKLYYNVRDNYFPVGTFGNWSENGCHVTIDYTNPDFLPGGMLWYFTRIDVEVLPATTAGTVTVIYRGWGNDGSVSEIRSRKVTNHTINGDTSVSVTETAPVVTGYDFLSSSVGDSESALTDTQEGVGSRSVQINSKQPTKFIVFTYQQKPAGTPTIGITANPQSVTPGQAYTVSDLSRPSEGAARITRWRVREEFTPKNGGAVQNILSERDITSPETFFKSYSKTAEGTYTYTLTSVTDNLNRVRTGSASVSVTVGAAAPVSQPPVANINAPPRVTQGDNVTIDASGSYDPDGTIVNYSYSLPAHEGNISGSRGTVSFTSSGTYTLEVTVTDNDGLTDSADRQIIVDPPIPWAVITYTGNRIENHKITLSAAKSTSPSKYPIDHTKTLWTVTPISGGTANDIKYRGELTGREKEVMFKKAGRYKISLIVTNTAGYSNTNEAEIEIGPDLPPIADVTLPATSIRDKVDSNGKHYGVLPIYNVSSSPDGDTIGRFIIHLTYDSDNDGSFTDETTRAIYDSSSNPTGNNKYYNDRPDVLLYEKTTNCVNLAYPSELTGPTDTVGKIRVDIEVWERLDESNSFPEFLLPEDVKHASTLIWR